MTPDPDPAFESLLQFLEQSRGFDFRGYKRQSLMRRVSRRMQELGIEGYDSYQDYLELHQDEFARLFNTILINVTTFFRDPPAWESLQQNVVAALAARGRPDELLRVWSAGCASGEEAYSLAMAFAEALGEEALRRRVKIYATDIDEEALAQARLATYTAKQMEDLGEARRERFFEQQNGRFTFRTDLRRAVIFGRNDLMQDAPISRLHLLVCRNTLMYFNSETQKEILQRFHFALNGSGEGGGHLFLGRAEMMLGHGDLFSAVDLRSRIFSKVPPAAPAPPAARMPREANGGDMESTQRLSELAIEDSPVPRLVIDTAGALVLANARARLVFSLSARDIGRPFEDFDVFRHPADMRALLEQAYAERRPVTLTSVERRFASGESRFFDVLVSPVYEGETPRGVAITFVDVTRYATLQAELTRAREEVESTNEELQSSNEELETTNEELHSSNEELETTNEELQSTNEELETMNEELQSTNEELQTVNEELRTRSEELNQVNSFLESVMSSLSAGAVAVNRNLDVLMWNHRAEDLWGLRAHEVQGKSLLNLDIGLPVAELRALVRPCLAGEAERQSVVLDAVNRRGKPIKCRVTCTPLFAGSKREGVILLMEEV